MLKSNTIYATFPTERDAERAAGALMDHGVRAASVSFVIPHGDAAPTIVAGTPHMPGAKAAMPASYPSDLPIPDTQTPVPAPTGGINLNTGTRIGEDVSVTRSAPGYQYDALGAVIPDSRTTVPATYTPPADRIDPIPINTLLQSTPDFPRTDRVAVAADAPLDVVDTDHGHVLDVHRSEPHAAGGITTTSGRDAAKGAAEGAGIGLGLGALLGLAAIAVPGIGWVAGAGALVASLAAATGAAGAVAGGVFGYLADMGVPAHYAHTLQTHLQAGGMILSVAVTDGIPETEIIALLEKYGATSAQAF